jgi:hypothetical protein
MMRIQGDIFLICLILLLRDIDYIGDWLRIARMIDEVECTAADHGIRAGRLEMATWGVSGLLVNCAW